MELTMLEEEIELIAEKAKKYGLDYFPVRFEICPADIIYTFGAYAMPTRFSHWSFGKAFYRMKTQYDFNLSRIYELVINSDPCYAFLLEGNGLLQNKLVAAHVFAHCDFFKHNATFRRTSRGMVESMAVSADKVRELEFKHGVKEVERIIDAALAIQYHIDPRPDIGQVSEANKAKLRLETPYDDLFALDTPPEEAEIKEQMAAEQDLLRFIMQNSRNLKDWQREILAVIHAEMLYFSPQLETKIMNEGWASYWHDRIMREMDLTADESVEFAVMHSSVVAPSQLGLNPYYLGFKIWEDIERRWDNPQAKDRENLRLRGGEGRQKMFEVRESENDLSFVRNYLTNDLIRELDLFVFEKSGRDWIITEKDCDKVRNKLVVQLVNSGHPYIVVADGDYKGNGELLLQHCHEGVDLDVPYLERTLAHVHTLWGRTVHLRTEMDGKPVIYSQNGERAEMTNG